MRKKERRRGKESIKTSSTVDGWKYRRAEGDKMGVIITMIVSCACLITSFRNPPNHEEGASEPARPGRSKHTLDALDPASHSRANRCQPRGRAGVEATYRARSGAMDASRCDTRINNYFPGSREALRFFPSASCSASAALRLGREGTGVLGASGGSQRKKSLSSTSTGSKGRESTGMNCLIQFWHLFSAIDL